MQRQDACSSCKAPQGSTTTFKVLESYLMRGVTKKCDFSRRFELRGWAEHPIPRGPLERRGRRGWRSYHSTNHAHRHFTQRQDACSACETPEGSTTNLKPLESFLMRGTQTNATSADNSSYGGGSNTPSLRATLEHRGRRGWGVFCVWNDILQDNDWHFVLMLGVAPTGKWYLGDFT
ncbi:hypothetical protein CDAR_111111 [Caerostris darwini]|uniref:Uncharacterized protein n=1 Tax=Caerostris darwini TaxID=1538125 RepID=A0AAV4SUB9_9ARAC|nr:hypothetical protein CDAR_111111 [Caerostris darwini]